MKKVNRIEVLKQLEHDHVCEKCGKLLSEAKRIYVKEYEGDASDYCCECVEEQ